ncbi:MAG: rhodanese-like domain-containing protein [Nitriliruptor sp.]|uniref:rhodanese-like domain-containing protein n=1 Tax=Nitriliruptor sp. TaxID=2448056 RepID=UPI0034A00262
MTTLTTAPVLPGEHLAPAELRSWLESADAPHVLDVRSPAEFETVHIPGSYNVPLETLREHRERLARHLDEHAVLVCRSGMRAKQAETAFAAVGLPNVHVLDGGVSAWEAEGAPVERGAARWDLERQVRLVAGGIVLAAGLGSVVVPGLRWIATGIGAGLVTAAATDTCAMGAVLSKLPYNRGAASCDVDAVVAELAGTATSAR